MRTTLRGWLHEATADQWSDAALNAYLNHGVRESQKVVVSLEPESIKKTYKANLTTGPAGADKLFGYPAGTWGVIELATSADGISFTPMRRISLAQARSGLEGFVPWSPRLFAVFPTPSTSVTNG